MSRWARWTTKPNTGLSLNKFMTEAPQSAAAIEAERQGLEFAGFAKYRDPKTGQIVARVVGDELVAVQGEGGAGAFGTTGATTDTGNPTGGGYMGPADRARQMGLQSDGSGGYVDPSTGQVVARTVNNELVFYSPQGGAVSDGAGGEQLTQQSPSWVDPVTGELMVPPAQPESPEEKMAVPAPVPALAPASYNMFMNIKRKRMYKSNAEQTAAQQDIDGQQAEVDDVMNEHPGMRELQRQMQDVIEKASNSGDPKKAAIAGIAQDIIENEAGDMLKYFAMGTEEQQEDILKKLKTQILSRAKMEEVEMRDGFEKISNLEDDEYDAYVESRRKRKVATDFLDDTHDENLGVPDAPRLKAGKDYPEEIEGDQVVYNLKPYRVEMNQPLVRDARKAGRQAGLNMRNFKDAVTVEWETKEESLDPRKKRAAALEAVKLWRDEVLPTLPAGTVVVANPTETEKDKKSKQIRGQRERIYQMAGMGSTDARGIMAGLVTDEGTIVPIRPTAEQKKKMQMESKYINLIGQNLNNEEIKLVYEMLFT